MWFSVPNIDLKKPFLSWDNSDAVNFPANEDGVQVNPFGTPDPTAEFPKEIYTIDRKSTENREIVQFELAAVFDIAGVRAPQRQCTRTLFPAIGSFIIWVGKIKHYFMHNVKNLKNPVDYC